MLPCYSDEEPAPWLKTVAYYLGKLGPPGGPQNFNSAIALQAKEEAKKRAGSHEEWLAKSYLEGTIRVRPGVTVKPQ